MGPGTKTEPKCDGCRVPLALIREAWMLDGRYHKEYECFTQGCNLNWRTKYQEKTTA